VHTGLGETGHGELVYTLDCTTKAARVAQTWFGDMGILMLGDAESSTTQVHGTMNHAFLDARPTTLSISIEYGTVDFPTMFSALREENLLHRLGLLGSAEGVRASMELLRCFRPDDDRWRRVVILRFEDVISRIVERGSQWLSDDRRKKWG
jgi:hypothetical protein